MDSETLMQEMSKLRKLCDGVWNKQFAGGVISKSTEGLKLECSEIRKEIAPIIEQQTLLAGEVKVEPRDLDAVHKQFLEFAEKMNIEMNKVELFYDGVSEFRLRAKSEIKPCELMVKVPRKAVINVDLVKKSIFFKRCFDRETLFTLEDELCLAAYICVQKLQTDSFWHPYFNILPENFDTPFYYSEDELKRLHPSLAFDDALIGYRNMVREWIFLLREAFEIYEYDRRTPAQQRRLASPLLHGCSLTPTNFTFDLYVWCTSFVTSRASTMPSRDQEQKGPLKTIPCLFPVLDLARHDNNPENLAPRVEFLTTDETVRLVAKRHYAAGEEIKVDFGLRCSSENFVSLGYVPDTKMEFDFCKIRFGFAPSNEFYETRIQMMNNFIACSPKNCYIFKVHGQPPHFGRYPIQFSRIHALDRADDFVLERLNHPDVIRRGWAFLEQRMKLLILALGNLESAKHYSTRQKRILELKRAERRVFEVARGFCEATLERLQTEQQMVEVSFDHPLLSEQEMASEMDPGTKHGTITEEPGSTTD